MQKRYVVMTAVIVAALVSVAAGVHPAAPTAIILATTVAFGISLSDQLEN